MSLSWIDVKACSKVMSTTQTVKLKCRAADLHTDCFHFSFFLRRSYRVRQTAGGCRQLKTFFSLYLTDRACGFDEAHHKITHVVKAVSAPLKGTNS